MRYVDKSSLTISLITILFYAAFVWLGFSHVKGEEILVGYITAFTATMLGVLWALDVQRRLEARKRDQDKEDLKGGLRGELERIEKAGYGHLLYPRIWESAVSSGRLMLFSSEELLKLTPVYNFVQGLEYEAIRLRDVKEDYKRTNDSELGARWYNDSQVITKKQDQLRERIQKLLQDEKLWAS